MSHHQSKTLTFVSRRPPYGGENSQVCLELVLASAVFDQRVHYVFVEDGVYQLLASQQPDGIGSKNLGASLGALELYGVDKVYVDQQSLLARNLTSKDLIVYAEILDDEKLRSLIRESDVVFNL